MRRPHFSGTVLNHDDYLVMQLEKKRFTFFQLFLFSGETNLGFVGYPLFLRGFLQRVGIPKAIS